jgi:hypothetical protein
LPAGFGRVGTLWFEFTPAVTEVYEFGTCGNTTDVVISLWQGGQCGPYSPLSDACNDDHEQVTNCAGATAAYLTARLTAGQTVRIAIASVVGVSLGTFRLTVQKSFHVAGVQINGKRLLVTGRGFGQGARILVDGVVQKTANDLTDPTTLLIGKKAGKKIRSGQQVRIRVRNPNGVETDEFFFTRP